jgi:peptide/nickel transport system ATP-binding protein
MFTVEQSLIEPLRIHNIQDDRQDRIREALADAELHPPEKYLDRTPDQLSGGEKQRVSIARALVVDPEILLADEPVSMLDVSTQAEVLKLLGNLVEERGLTLIYISHDLSTVGYVCDMTSVMYLGRMVELAPTLELVRDPKHPYSEALIEAIPIPDPHVEYERVDLEGAPEDPIGLGEGCRFRDRCPERMDICEKTPLDHSLSEERTVACHLYYDHDAVTETGTDTVTAPDGGSAKETGSLSAIDRIAGTATESDSDSDPTSMKGEGDGS